MTYDAFQKGPGTRPPGRPARPSPPWLLSPVERIWEEALDLDQATHGKQSDDGKEVHVQRKPRLDILRPGRHWLKGSLLIWEKKGTVEGNPKDA